MRLFKELNGLILFTVILSLNLSAQPVTKPDEARQYTSMNFYLEGNFNYKNPFDLITNKLELRIVMPDFTGTALSFFYDGKDETGKERWEARFTPKLSGNHLFSVIKDGKLTEQFSINVQVNDESFQGGLKLSDRYGVFEYESGEKFRGLGLNICWAEDYEYYFRKMKQSGLNITRIWMCPWNLSFEWSETGLGRYNLTSARRLDDILQLAEHYGIFIILCMDYHGIAQKGMGFFRENKWLENPYNKLNGGPCTDAAELFTNTEAREFYKKRYKYIISRFGHSRRIAAWEFYNEADLMAGKSIPVNRWHVEMAEYIKSIDVHQRLVSTSSTRNFPEKVIDAFKSPALDFVMYHEYNRLDFAPYITDLHEAALEYYHKPVVIGEFGVEYRGGDRTHLVDSMNVGLHNGIWAGFFNETPVIPLSWWWDSYIDKHDLWYEYANLSDFAGELNLSRNRLIFKALPPGFLKLSLKS